MQGRNKKMKFYEPFRKVEECENLLGHSVFVKTQKAILLKVKMNGRLLEFTFQMEHDNSFVEYSSLNAFYVVTMNEHPFGREMKSKD